MAKKSPQASKAKTEAIDTEEEAPEQAAATAESDLLLAVAVSQCIEDRYGPFDVTEEQAIALGRVSDAVKVTAQVILHTTPPGNGRRQALELLRQAQVAAHDAIGRGSALDRFR